MKHAEILAELMALEMKLAQAQKDASSVYHANREQVPLDLAICWTALNDLRRKLQQQGPPTEPVLDPPRFLVVQGSINVPQFLQLQTYSGSPIQDWVPIQSLATLFTKREAKAQVEWLVATGDANLSYFDTRIQAYVFLDSIDEYR